MKICFVSQSFEPDIGGLESYVATVSEEHRRNGHSVTVLCGTRTNEPASSRDAGESINVVRLTHLQSFCDGRGSFFAAISELQHALSVLRPDVVNVQDPLSLLLVSIAGVTRTSRVVFTPHWTFDHWKDAIPRRDWSRGILDSESTFTLEREMMFSILNMSPFHKLIAVADSFLEWAVDILPNDPRVRFLPNCVDLRNFRPQDKTPPVFQPLGIPDGRVVVLCPSRIIPRKGLNELIDAARITRDMQIVYVLLGQTVTGKELFYHELRAKIAHYGMLEQVHIASPSELNLYGRPSEYMPRVYAASSVVVLPSHYEGLSTVALEAAACGLPLALSDIPANVSIFGTERAARFFRVGSAPDIAAAISSLLNDPSECAQLCHNAREVVERKYDAAAVVRELERLYE